MPIQGLLELQSEFKVSLRVLVRLSQKIKMIKNGRVG